MCVAVMRGCTRYMHVCLRVNVSVCVCVRVTHLSTRFEVLSEGVSEKEDPGLGGEGSGEGEKEGESLDTGEGDFFLTFFLREWRRYSLTMA